MSISSFFADVLGAKLKNTRWSWGAFDPIANRVFLRVWEDRIETTAEGERVHVAFDQPRRKSPGFKERHDHLAKMREGVEGFGVVCTATDPHTNEARSIKTINQDTLLRLGELTTERGQTYAHITDRIPVGEVSQRTAESTLTDDLKSLTQLKIDPTTKEALISARVGQGLFRARVLQQWGYRCSVTGSGTLDAIRASHIKPWCKSTDEERLDPENGLPLVASLDALFDAGLISFTASGKLIVSPRMSAEESQLFGLRGKSLAQTPTPRTVRYLAFHLDQVFRR